MIVLDGGEHSYTARWILPIDRPPLEHGNIVIAGERIVAVESQGVRRADFDLGNVAILPGFVNAHTHLDLSGLRGLCAPTADFTQWLRQVITFRRLQAPGQVETDIAAGLQECLGFGTTLLGDISFDGSSWKALTQANCRSVVFRELIGLSKERAEQSARIAEEWLRDHPATDRTVPGLSPHAPYSVRSTLYQAAARHPVPIATHLAETEAELELLQSGSGAMVEFLRELNALDPSGLIADPVEVLRTLPSGIFVHGNYLEPDAAFAGGQSLVVCPRTHAAFGHRRHPFPEMAKHGVRVALGTDSLASNPDLDILAEARYLRRAYPEVPPATILRMLTLNGAEALGFGDVTGSLTPGKSADVVVLPLPDGDSSDAHALVLDSATKVRRVMFCGVWTNSDAWS